MAPARRWRRWSSGTWRRARRVVDPRFRLRRPEFVFVVGHRNRGWILEGMCREIAARVSGESGFHSGRGPLPPAERYFFAHYLLFLRAREDPELRRRPSFVLFTHPGRDASKFREAAHRLRACTKVISISSIQAQALVDAGLPEEKLVVVTPGADPALFRPHERANRAVGLCSAYQPRKAPHLVLDLVRSMPHRNFRLLGRRWRDAPTFDILNELPNFQYVELEYSEYPRFYDEIDVFVSPSDVEGGPIPLIEAMMANAVPVATRTGFAPDVIRTGENGFICEVGAPAGELAELVDAAYELDANVRATVEHLTWEAFSDGVLRIAGARGTATNGPVEATG